MTKQLTDVELSAFIPERLASEWQESRTHPHCKWDADAVVDFLRELALSRARLGQAQEALRDIQLEASEADESDNPYNVLESIDKKAQDAIKAAWDA